MAKKIFIFLITLLIVFGLLTFYFKKSEEIKASPGSSHNVSGWAWANFYPEIEAGVLKAASGWISFNCYNDYNNDGILESHCTDAGYHSNYGVHICESDTDTNCIDLSTPKAGKFVGHAWFGGGQDAAGNPTPTLGWISFDRNETGDPPGPPFNGSEDFIAKVDNVSSSICDTDSNGFLDTWCGGNNSTTSIGNYRQVFGWARVLAGTSTPGGWSGWIKLSKHPDDGGANYGVTIDMTANPKEFKGWAWGGGGTATANAVVGWISFNTTNYPGGADYKVITTLVINSPPTAVISCCPNGCPCTTPGNCTGYIGEFCLQNDSTDPDNNIANSIWKIIQNGETLKTLDCSITGNPTCNFTPSGISAGTYTARLEVTDTGGLSDIATTSITLLQDIVADFRCSLNPAGPWQDCEGFGIEEGVVVYFNSEDYSEPSTGAVINHRSWTFVDGTPSSITDNVANPTSTFTKVDANSGTVTLQAWDTAGRTDSQTYHLQIRLPLPKWKEIPPR